MRDAPFRLILVVMNGIRARWPEMGLAGLALRESLQTALLRRLAPAQRRPLHERIPDAARVLMWVQVGT